ncbi:MAG: glycosyltransferase family 39 protein, partial [Anaerolineales bacterium]|nr:glycosyltransferase family 39 protein [Anaerolineales bacterium]
MNRGLRIIKQHCGIVLILAAFFALGITYSVITPLFEAPDELQHYARIKRLAEAMGLIQLDPIVSQLAHQQRYQQPLYHLVGALATFWDDAGDMPQLLWFNPHADIGVAKADGNVNLLIHTSEERFPYRGTSLGVHALRFLSVLMGTGTVLITYLIALEIFPQRQYLALGAAAVNAFIPQFLFISGAVNNDNLVTILSSIILWLLIPLMERPISAKRSVLLGIIIGLATLTKVNSLGLLPLAVLVVAVSSYRQRSVKVFISRTALLLVA